MFKRNLEIIVKDIYIIIIISIGFTYRLWSQPGKIDSLLNVCNKTKFDTVKVDNYNEIAFYLSEDDFEKSDYYSNRAKAIAIKIGYKQGISRSEYLIGQTNYYRENYKRALEHYFESLRLSETTDKTINYAYTTVQIGNTYYLITDYPNALKYYNKAFEIFDYLNSDIGRSIIFNNLANLQTIDNQFDSAISNYKKQLRLTLNKKS
ncbi:MAG: tetratricopeptide repeat protein [Chloroflexia bacterium]|nr:tetratricopeptide repeat protein [Chloroflexia bacterium]